MMQVKTRNWITMTLLATTMTGALPAQSETTPFDPAGLRQELEIMEGILHTTLKYALEESDSGPRAFSRRTESFYLYGQGAVFVVNLPFRRSRDIVREVARQKRGIARQERELSRIKNALGETEDPNILILKAQQQVLTTLASIEADAASDAPPPTAPTWEPLPPAPPTAPTWEPLPPAPPVAFVEQAPEQVLEPLKERLQSLQNRLQVQQRQMEEHNAEIEKKMVDVEKALLEALSRHGGSFRSLSEGEFVTLILNQGEKWLGRSPSQARVLVVPKSALMAFAADRIGWDDLLHQVVSYQM